MSQADDLLKAIREAVQTEQSVALFWPNCRCGGGIRFLVSWNDVHVTCMACDTEWTITEPAHERTPSEQE